VLDGLRQAEFGTGLTDAFGLAIANPTPAVTDRLYEATFRRETSVHAAAALAFLCGHAAEPFDRGRGDFFLRFNDDDPNVRIAAFRQLCAECGVDPEPHLHAWRQRTLA
jgi:hypothetical protein